MQKADDWLRLMKQRTDALVATDEKLQQFLIWVKEKSLSVEVPYKPAVVRAFYFALDIALVPVLVPVLDRSFYSVLVRTLDRTLDPALISVPALVPALERALARALARISDGALVPALERALDLAFKPELRQALQELKDQLPNRNGDKEIFKQWWQANGKAWTEQLRAVMIQHRNIGHNWQFSKEQKELLKQYYDANRLLVDCLKSSCNVTPV